MMYDNYEVTYEERHYFSRLVGRILSDDECESIHWEVKELEESIMDDCEDEPYGAYMEGLKEIINSYK